MRKNSFPLFAFGILLAFDLFVWYRVVFSAPAANPEFYFLDVGQGDSELVVFPGNAKILIDAGPDQKVVRSLEKILPSTDRYIDIAVITHPQLDHFNGFNDLIKRYEIGALIINGREAPPEIAEWKDLFRALRESGKDISILVLGEGDAIRRGRDEIIFLSPDSEWLQSGELNDTSLVSLIKTGGATALFTGDIGFPVEEFLQSKFDIRADILKVGHHGSKYSSGDGFLEAVKPKLAVVEVGKNRYGHPTKEALERLGKSGAKIFRTDQSGTVRVLVEEGKLKVFTERRE